MYFPTGRREVFVLMAEKWRPSACSQAVYVSVPEETLTGLKRLRRMFASGRHQHVVRRIHLVATRPGAPRWHLVRWDLRVSRWAVELILLIRMLLDDVTTRGLCVTVYLMFVVSARKGCMSPSNRCGVCFLNAVTHVLVRP